jgi:hypothetical protein
VEAAIKALPPDSVIVVSREGDKPRLLALPDFHLVALVDEPLDQPGRRPYTKLEGLDLLGDTDPHEGLT